MVMAIMQKKAIGLYVIYQVVASSTGRRNICLWYFRRIEKKYIRFMKKCDPCICFWRWLFGVFDYSDNTARVDALDILTP